MIENRRESGKKYSFKKIGIDLSKIFEILTLVKMGAEIDESSQTLTEIENRENDTKAYMDCNLTQNEKHTQTCDL